MLCLGCMAGVIALLLHSAVDFNLHIPANALLFFVLLAIGFNTVLLRGEGKHMEVIAPTRVLTIPRIWRYLFLSLVLCAFVLLGRGVIRSYLAQRAVSDVQEQVALYAHGKLPSWVDVYTLLRLQQAQELSPGYALPHYLLAKAYEQMALAQRGEEAKAVFVDLAAREYKTAIDLEPTSAWCHLGLGWAYLVLSERDHSLQAMAKREFEIAAQLAPKDPAIQRYLREISIDHAP